MFVACVFARMARGISRERWCKDTPGVEVCGTRMSDRRASRKRLGGLLGLLGEKHSVDVGEDTAGGDGHAAEQLVELLIVADGELDVPGDDAALLVVAGGVACELEDLGGKGLEDGGEVHWGTSANTGSVAAGAEVAVDATHRELEAGLCRAGGRLS